jgi:drug/metabolite transporter superfamily protein YnfA
LLFPPVLSKNFLQALSFNGHASAGSLGHLLREFKPVHSHSYIGYAAGGGSQDIFLDAYPFTRCAKGCGTPAVLPSSIDSFFLSDRGLRLRLRVFCGLKEYERGNMRRERFLKVVLVVVGLVFSALVYPLILYVKEEPALSMMMSVYVTLGIFLLLASRNPPAHRSLIAFTAWSSVFHAVLMGFQAFRDFIQHGELIGSAVLIVIGIALIVLAPRERQAN